MAEHRRAGGAGSPQAAAKLTKFFQELKLLANGGNADELGIDASFYQGILAYLPKTMGLGNKKWFGKSTTASGAEIDVSRIGGAAIAAGLGKQDFSKNLANWVSTVNTGSVKTNPVNLSADLLDGVCKEAVGYASQLMQTRLRELVNESAAVKAGHALGEISGKPDVDFRTAQIDVKIIPSGRYQEIAQLFATASFSIKNYTIDFFYKKKEEVLWNHIHNGALRLGDTNFYRVLAATLSSYGYSMQVINSAFFAAINSELDAESQLALWRIRFIYELTGQGMKNFKQEIFGSDANATYFLLNEPDGGIYVRAADDLIYEILSDNSMSVTNWMDGAITLDRSYMVGHAVHSYSRKVGKYGQTT